MTAVYRPVPHRAAFSASLSGHILKTIAVQALRLAATLLSTATLVLAAIAFAGA